MKQVSAFLTLQGNDLTFIQMCVRFKAENLTVKETSE